MVDNKNYKSGKVKYVYLDKFERVKEAVRIKIESVSEKQDTYAARMDRTFRLQDKRIRAVDNMVMYLTIAVVILAIITLSTLGYVLTLPVEIK